MLAEIAAILGALAPIIGLVVKFYQASSAHAQQQTGAQLEAGKVDAVSLPAETAIATAEANAPTTRLAVIDRLRAGTA